jgi:Domain of unknown function (DU1801)
LAPRALGDRNWHQHRLWGKAKESVMMAQPFSDPAVKAVFDAYAPRLRVKLLELRKLIFLTASKTEGVGELVEALKWHQPAYLTMKTKSGSTIRIDALSADDRSYAIYFHCQTNLVATFRELYPERFSFEGNRAIHFSLDEAVPQRELKHCIALALTYHLRH